MGLSRLDSPVGLAPRARHVLRLGTDTGRLRIENLDVTLAAAGGALLGLIQLLDDEPHMDAAAAGDDLAANLLCMFGLPYDEARQLSKSPLPAPS